MMVGIVCFVALGMAGMWLMMSEKLAQVRQDQWEDLLGLQRRAEEALEAVRRAGKLHGETEALRICRWRVIGICEVLEKRVGPMKRPGQQNRADRTDGTNLEAVAGEVLS
jgi:hypothetical protein